MSRDLLNYAFKNVKELDGKIFGTCNQSLTCFKTISVKSSSNSLHNFKRHFQTHKVQFNNYLKMNNLGNEKRTKLIKGPTNGKPQIIKDNPAAPGHVSAPEGKLAKIFQGKKIRIERIRNKLHQFKYGGSDSDSDQTSETTVTKDESQHSHHSPVQVKNSDHTINDEGQLGNSDNTFTKDNVLLPKMTESSATNDSKQVNKPTVQLTLSKNNCESCYRLDVVKDMIKTLVSEAKSKCPHASKENCCCTKLAASITCEDTTNLESATEDTISDKDNDIFTYRVDSKSGNIFYHCMVCTKYLNASCKKTSQGYDWVNGMPLDTKNKKKYLKRHLEQKKTLGGIKYW